MLTNNVYCISNYSRTTEEQTDSVVNNKRVHWKHNTHRHVDFGTFPNRQLIQTVATRFSVIERPIVLIICILAFMDEEQCYEKI